MINVDYTLNTIIVDIQKKFRVVLYKKTYLARELIFNKIHGDFD